MIYDIFLYSSHSGEIRVIRDESSAFILSAAAPEDHSIKDGGCHHRVREGLQEGNPALQRPPASSQGEAEAPPPHRERLRLRLLTGRGCSLPSHRVCVLVSPVQCVVQVNTQVLMRFYILNVNV